MYTRRFNRLLERLYKQQNKSRPAWFDGQIMENLQGASLYFWNEASFGSIKFYDHMVCRDTFRENKNNLYR